MKGKPNDLEKVIHKERDLVLCPLKLCKISGEYWRCYTNSYKDCGIYLNYILHEKHGIEQ